VIVCRKPLFRISDRVGSGVGPHLPGIGAVALVSAIATLSGGRMPTAATVALLIAAVGAAVLSGGLGPAASAGGVALVAWWLLGLPFDVFLFGAFALGGLLFWFLVDLRTREELAKERAEVHGAIVYEVTDRRRAEAEREALLREAERVRTEAEVASRAKDEFLAVLSHELRAPLQGVLAWVSLLRDGRLDPAQQARAMQAIERSTRLQTRLVNDLLDVSRIISGKLTLDWRRLDVAAVVRAAVDQFRASAAARGLGLDATIVDCGLTLGDPERLKQALGNLLSNAIEFTPSGGTITVRCGRAGREVVLVVEDTGEGIAPEFLPHIFERFRQADSSSARRHGGLGIGLAIVRRLVELHGGRIAAHSDGVGRGASFTIRLPVHDPGGSRPADAPAASGGLLNGRHVLVVEDDADSREAIALTLEVHGAHVRSAGSADEALAQLDGGPLDAILSDLSMPEMDGYALFARLRARGIDVPVVAVSGFATPEDRARTLAAGFSAHVAKPVDVDVLLHTVARLLEAPTKDGDTGRITRDE